MDGFPNYLGEISLIVLDSLLGADNEISGNVMGCKKSILHMLLLKVSEYVYGCCHFIKPLLCFWFGFFSLLCRDWVPLHHAC